MSSSPSDSLLSVHVRGIRIEADGVRSFELWPDQGVQLPPADAGSHIDVHLAGGLVRQYSITNPGEAQRYVIGVNRDAKSRGGSKHLHDTVRVGDRLKISAPRNHFRLDEQAAQTVLVAGGIGITPLYAMAQRLLALDSAFTLYYCARSRDRAAFLDALAGRMSGSPKAALVPVFDDEAGVASLGLSAVVARHPEADFYCCGPEPLMQAFVKACDALPAERVHVEYFAGAAPVPPDAASTAADASTFVVRLARSQREVAVPPGVSILDALAGAGITVFNSCRQGVCGSCETAVLEGTPDHRDRVLSPSEREANNTMMVCVSRCRGESLVLDL